ncbi:hypothetical protein ES703_79319 [subsurface metagenome]
MVLEVDGTMIHSQEKGEDDFKVKLGIMYSGKELESKKAKHKRYRLKDKVTYGGIEGADDFGERLYIRGEEKLSLSLARNLLLISDGARWISDIAGTDYLKATYQLDWWHYQKNIDVMLCRRFKGRGMSWSRAGAQNLLKLRLLRYDRKDWKAYWRQRVN